MKANAEARTAGCLQAALALRGRVGIAAAALLYAILLALIFPEAVFEGRVFISPDSVAPRGFSDYLEREGVSAHWNPFIFGGMPAYASLGHDRNLYLPGPLLRGATRLFSLPPLTWLLAHYIWLGLGVFLFVRARGVRPWLAWLAGAWFLMLPPQIAIGAHGHGSKVMTLAWLPWLLVAADRLLSRRRLLADAALLAAAAAGLLLAAHIQVAYYALITLALYALGRLALILRREGWRRALVPLGLGLAALAIAAAASAPLYGPVWEYSARSIRGAAEGGGTGFDYATAWSLAPAEWTTFLWPASWGYGAESYAGRMPMTDYANYLGWLPLTAAALLFWGRPRRPFDLFFLGLALATTLVAAGRYLPLAYRPLYELLPGFNRFRVPVMILLLQQLALAVLMARGLERAWRERTSLLRLRNLVAAGALVLFLSAALGPALQAGPLRAGLQARYGAQLARVEPSRAAAFLDQQVALAGRWLRQDALRSGLLLLPFLALLEWRRRQEAPVAVPPVGWTLVELAGAGALALALLVDLVPLDHQVLHPERHWETRRGVSLWGDAQPTASRLPARTLAFLEQNLDGQRFYALPGSAFAANEAGALGLASLGGYHAAKPAVADSLLKALPVGGAAILDRLAVRFIVTPQTGGLGPGFPLAAPAGSTEEAVYRNEGALPRLRLAERLRVEAPAASRQRLFTGRTEPDVVAVEADPGLRLSPAEGAPGEVSATSWGLDTIDCRARLDRPALLVLADLAYPGWQVSVDGQPRPLLLADGLLRAVALEPGDHAVSFRFLPPRLALYRGLRGTAWLLLLALAAAGLAPRGGWRRGRLAPAKEAAG